MVSRRSFLASGMAGLTAGALGGCRTEESESDLQMVPPAAPHDDAWVTVRAQFAIDESVTYLNNASLGMPPTRVADAVARGYAMLSRDPLHGKHALTDVIVNHSIPALAAFVGADPDEVMLTRNATEPLHLQAIGLELSRGDEVLMTTQEHPAGAKPWRYRQARHGVAVKEVFIPSPFETPDQVVDLIAAKITTRTRAIAFCHVTRGGHLYPVKQLCAVARERGIASVVDGAQAVGMLPIDLHDLGCDVYAASLHKWMLGPMGTDMWYVSRRARERWYSSFEPQPSPEQPGYAPGGTPDLPLRASVATAVEFVERLGIQAIAARDRYLSDYLKQQLADISAARIVSGPTRDTSAPGSTIFVLEGVDPIEGVAALDERKLYIDEHVRDGHPAFRVSTHFYNTTSEIDRAVTALTGLIPSAAA